MDYKQAIKDENAELKAVRKQVDVWKKQNNKRQVDVWTRTAEEIEKKIASLEERLMDDMYDATCDCCELRLSIDVDIMCWEGGECCGGEERTLCNDCYWNDTQDWWKTDTNSDNEHEVCGECDTPVIDGSCDCL